MSGQRGVVEVSRRTDVVNGRARPVSGPPVNARRLWPTIVVEPLSADDAIRDVVQEWGEQSFPASDPPANW